MVMNTIIKRSVSIILAALVLAVLAAAVMSENTYATIKMKKNLIIGVGQTAKLKVTGTKRKVKWSSTDKSIATVTSKGVVKAKNIGYCRIKAKVAGKTLKCAVKVKTVAEANARNLRNYIIKNGKKAKDGGRYIRKKWSEQGDAEEARWYYNAVVKAYSNKNDMYFEIVEDGSVDGCYMKCTMNIDLIAHKPGEIYTKTMDTDDGSYGEIFGEIGYDFEYDFGNEPRTKGLTVTKAVDCDEDGKITVHTDPSSLAGAVEVGGGHIDDAFSYFNKYFKKCGLKSRMQKLGFENYV